MTRDAEHTPSPQSVVVPDLAVAVERLTTLGDAFELWGAHGGNLISEDQALPMSRHIKLVLDTLAAAPAPSSLAGGEVERWIALRATPFVEGGLGDELQKRGNAYIADYVLSTDEGPDYEPNDFERELIEDAFAGLLTDEALFGPIRAILAALSPEAPAREGCVRVGSRATIKEYLHTQEVDVIGVDGDIAWIKYLSNGERTSVRTYALTPRHEAPSPRPELAPYTEDLKGIKAAMLADEAPAEGAGEVLHDGDIRWLTDVLEELMVGRAKRASEGLRIRRLQKYLRARSSAPEAREGEAVAWQMRLSSGRWGTILHGADKPLTEARPLYTHPSAPSADKLREALVWALAEIQGDTRYQNDGQRTAALDQALAALNAEGAK